MADSRAAEVAYRQLLDTYEDLKFILADQALAYICAKDRGAASAEQRLADLEETARHLRSLCESMIKSAPEVIR